MSASAEQLVSRLRTTFESGRTRDLDWRREQLRALSRMLSDNEDALFAALAEDLGKPRFEAWAGDIAASAGEAERHAARIAALIEGGGYDEVAVGGSVDVEARYVAPTVLTGVRPDAAVMGEEIFGPVLPVNTRAMIHGTREAARRMLPRGRGHIVNVASTAGKAGIAGSATYSASKAAVIGKKMGADHVFMDALDKPERSSYEARATGKDPS